MRHCLPFRTEIRGYSKFPLNCPTCRSLHPLAIRCSQVAPPREPRGESATSWGSPWGHALTVSRQAYWKLSPLPEILRQEGLTFNVAYD